MLTVAAKQGASEARPGEALQVLSTPTSSFSAPLPCDRPPSPYSHIKLFPFPWAPDLAFYLPSCCCRPVFSSSTGRAKGPLPPGSRSFNDSIAYSCSTKRILGSRRPGGLCNVFGATAPEGAHSIHNPNLLQITARTPTLPFPFF